MPKYILPASHVLLQMYLGVRTINEILSGTVKTDVKTRLILEFSSTYMSYPNYNPLSALFPERNSGLNVGPDHV